MNETPNPSNVPAPADPVTDALASLRAQFQATLIILIMICGALDLYLLKQYINLRKDVQALEPTVGQMIAGYQQATVPLATKFLGQLKEYAKTHPDFQAILAKYPLSAPQDPAGAAAQPAKPAAPGPAPAKAPATAPAPAKTTAPAAPPKK
jgi:hypothetical protein